MDTINEKARKLREATDAAHRTASAEAQGEAVPGAIWHEGSVSLIRRGSEDDYCARNGAQRVYFASPAGIAQGEARIDRSKYALVPVEPRPACCDHGINAKGGLSGKCCGNGACAQDAEEERARASWAEFDAPHLASPASASTASRVDAWWTPGPGGLPADVTVHESQAAEWRRTGRDVRSLFFATPAPEGAPASGEAKS